MEFFCSIFSTLEFILSRLKVLLLRYRRKRPFACIETGFTAFAVLFLTLCFSKSEIQLPRYGRKCVLAEFEIGFTALAVLFLAL